MDSRDKGAIAGAALIPRSPQRVMQLLEVVAATPGGVSLTNLSKVLNSPKSSVLNLLRALEIAGHVESVAGHYRAGPASLQLAAMLAGGNPFLRPIRPLLRRAAHDTGETALIGVLTRDGQHAMPVESVESRNPLRFAVPIGKPFALHNSAMGRAILAFKSPDFVAAYLDDAGAQASASGTAFNRTEIAHALAAARQSGVAEVAADRMDGILGFGAPIFDRDGHFEAAIVIGVPAARMSGRRAEIVGLVRQTGAEMSEILGYTNPYPSGTPQAEAL